MKKRLLSMLMVLCLMLTLAPMALAADTTNATMDETTFRNAVAAGGTVDMTGDVTLTSPLTISNSVTINGTSAKYAISYDGSETAYAITTTTSGVTLKNLTINGYRCVIAKASGLKIENCNINAKHHGVRFSIDGDNSGATLEITDTIIKNPLANNEYGVYYNSSNGGVVTSNIKNGVITMNNCQVLGYKYSIESYVDAVNSVRDSNNTRFDITDTTVMGWTALNIWSANTKFNFTNCTLVGINGLSGEYNNYSTIKANDGIYGGTTGKSSVVTFTGGQVISAQYGGSAQSLFNVDNDLQTQFVFQKYNKDGVQYSVELIGYSVNNPTDEGTYEVNVWNFYWSTDEGDADDYVASQTGYPANCFIAGGTIEDYEATFGIN